MSFRNTVFFFITGIILLACNKGKPLLVPDLCTDFFKGDSVIRNSDLMLIGPDIDSVNAEISADCDCCASKLAFLNDTSFIYEVLCLGGDSYVKGNYIIFGNLLLLHTDEEVISSNYEYATAPDLGDTPISYEVTRQKRDFHVYTISKLNEKTFITYHSKDDYKEYGMPVTGSLNDFLLEFRKEKVLREFLEAE